MATASVAHPDVRQALDQVVTDVRAAAAGNLIGIALYGGVAKGRYTPGISDVNILVVLRDVGFAALQALVPALTAARRRSRVAAWVVTPDDLRAAARFFPVKVSDIQAAHEVLFGDVQLGRIQVDRTAIRLRVQQELWNMEFRLRQRALERGADPPVLWGGIVASLPKLAVTLESVMRMRGVAVPADRAGVLRAAGGSLGVSAPRMDRFAKLRRHDPPPDDETVTALFGDYLDLLREVAATIEEGP